MLKVFGVMLECDVCNRYAQIVLAQTAEEAVDKRRHALRAQREHDAAPSGRKLTDAELMAAAKRLEADCVLVKVETLHYVNVE